MPLSSSQDFDFDAWATLAQADQSAFEKQRQEYLQKCISQAVQRGGSERKLQGMQSRLELERRRARTPMKACLRYYSLMWDSFVELREAWEDCLLRKKHMAHGATIRNGTPDKSAHIIAFPSPR